MVCRQPAKILRGLRSTLAGLVLLGGLAPIAGAASPGACDPVALSEMTPWTGEGPVLAAEATAERLHLDGARLTGVLPLHYDAGDGDDLVVTTATPNAVNLVAGPGADTVVVCDMPGSELHVTLNDATVGTEDTTPDRLVLGPEVFLGLAEGFGRHVYVFGITPQNDRVELHLPPGIELTGPVHDLRAGPVTLEVHGADASRLDKSVFEVVRAAAPKPVPTPEVPPPLSAYDAGLTCADAPSAPGSARQATEAALSMRGGELWGPEPDIVESRRVPGITGRLTGRGDDLLFVLSSVQADAGPGSDQVLVCGLDDPRAHLGLGSDYGADTVVVETGALQDGVARELIVIGGAAVNDRVVLRVPPGLAVEAVETDMTADAVVGDLTVRFGRTVGAPPPSFEAVYVIEEATAAPAPAPASAGPGPVDTSAACPDLSALGSVLAGAAQGQELWQMVYSPGDDRIVATGAVPGLSAHDASDGDDLVYGGNLPAGAVLAGGRGADVLHLCSMPEISAQIGLGPPTAHSDGAPDVAVLHPAVFAPPPAGLERHIAVHGFDAHQDRLVLRLPADVEPDLVEDRGTGVIDIRVGAVRIQVYHVVHADPVEAPLDAVELVATDVPAPPVTPAALEPPRMPFESCAAMPESGLAAPEHETDRYGVKTLAYGPGDDVVRIDGEPGWLLFRTRAGDDVIYLNDPLAGTQVHAGRGGDTILLCAMEEIDVTLQLGPHDTRADTLVIGRAVFEGVPEGFSRRISVTGLVPANDRILIDLPPGLSPEIDITRGGWGEVRAGGVVISGNLRDEAAVEFR